jgi:hypothetical protein
MHATCPAHLTLLYLIVLLHLVKSTRYEAPHYAVFANLLSFYPSSVQMFSSVPCSQIPSVCILPLSQRPDFTPI